MRVLLKIYEGCKYTEAGDPIEVAYANVSGWRVVAGAEAKKIEAESDGSCIDEYHEYLVIDFDDDETSTFRNSHVDLFKL